MEQDNECVTATIARFKNKEATGEKEVVKTKYVLGCDGARGASRKLLGLSFEGETKDADGQVWGDVEVEGLSNDVSGFLLAVSSRIELIGNMGSSGTFGVNLGSARTLHAACLSYWLKVPDSSAGSCFVPEMPALLRPSDFLSESLATHSTLPSFTWMSLKR